MHTRLILSLALLASCGGATASEPVAGAASAAQAGERPGPTEFPSLEQSYVAAERAYRKELETAKKPGSTAKEPAHPAIEFLPQFQSLADRGEGRANFWLGAHLHEAHPELAKDAATTARFQCYERIVDQHSDAPWIRDFARSLTSLYYAFGVERVDVLAERFAATCKNKEAVAEALYRSAAEARRAKKELRANALVERLKKEYGDTEYGRRVRGADDPVSGAAGGKIGLALGNVAPDFTTKDADGVEFKLSEYRGKVVVLDFWGFW